jgi:hypothetical protein
MCVEKLVQVLSAVNICRNVPAGYYFEGLCRLRRFTMRGVTPWSERLYPCKAPTEHKLYVPVRIIPCVYNKLVS